MERDPATAHIPDKKTETERETKGKSGQDRVEAPALPFSYTNVRPDCNLSLGLFLVCAQDNRETNRNMALALR